MKKIWMAGLLGFLLVGCMAAPSSENTQTSLEDNLMTENLRPSDQENTPLAADKLPGQLLFDFQPGDPAWGTVDDRVMGGVSQGASRVLDDGTLLFAGIMSLDNNGGFSSVRSAWNPIDLTGKDGLLLRVLGDGKIYRLRIRTTETGGEIAYNSFFETKDGQWTTVYIPFETMVPTLRGFQVPAGQLDPAAVSSLGLMLSDKQEGEFALKVDWIRAVSEPEIFPDGPPAGEN
jgi:NADH dehydrogenase [ubiquinone] 1 alpha subcomplex assembly factor 1